MVFKDNECAGGIYPLQGDAETDAPNQFTPKNVEGTPTGPFAVCHFCDQRTMIKINEPRKGYFVFHKSSIKGHVNSETAKLSGKPARVRGRSL